MAADLSADYNRPCKGDYILRSYKLGAVKVYKGDLLMVLKGTGYAVKAANTALGQFIGVAQSAVDNSGGSPGDLSVVVRIGADELIAKASAAITDVGVLATAVDSNDVTTGGSKYVNLGRIVGVEDATHVWVATAGTQIDSAAT
jgi:hypothetical protein